MTFRSDPFALARPCSAVWNRPDASATPTPSIQVRVRPIAEVPVKLLTNLVSIWTKPSRLNRLTTFTTSPVTGLTALTSKMEQIAEAAMTIIHREINSSMGFGILLPKISTPRRNRSSGPFWVCSMDIAYSPSFFTKHTRSLENETRPARFASTSEPLHQFGQAPFSLPSRLCQPYCSAAVKTCPTKKAENRQLFCCEKSGYAGLSISAPGKRKKSRQNIPRNFMQFPNNYPPWALFQCLCPLF